MDDSAPSIGNERPIGMESRDKPHVILAQIVAVLGTFALTSAPKWFSIMTMTTVGTVGTCTGCIIYLPVLLVVDLIFFWAASRQKTASSRSRILALVAVANRSQVAIMTPTEILANQHFVSIERYLRKSKLRRVLLTGGLTGKDRKKLLADIRQGRMDIIVHARCIARI